MGPVALTDAERMQHSRSRQRFGGLLTFWASRFFPELFTLALGLAVFLRTIFNLLSTVQLSSVIGRLTRSGHQSNKTTHPKFFRALTHSPTNNACANVKGNSARRS